MNGVVDFPTTNMSYLVEDCLIISINRIQALGVLNSPKTTPVMWQNAQTQEVLSEINAKFDGERLWISYDAVKRETQEVVSIGSSIGINWTYPALGGKRPWFNCPVCNSRVGKLYKPDGEYYFWCRHCWKLEYQSQQDAQNPLAVILNRLSRLEKKLGVYGKENSTNRSELPPRPKGQHKKTYQKNIKKYLETEEAVIHTVEAILNKLTGDDLLYEKT